MFNRSGPHSVKAIVDAPSRDPNNVRNEASTQRMMIVVAKPAESDRSSASLMLSNLQIASQLPAKRRGTWTT